MSCQINSGEPINGMTPIYLENDLMKVGVLPDRGGDIFELIYKPNSIAILLRLDKPISNPSRDFSQRRDTLNQFEDHYYGGWQSIFPNSAPMNYFGAHLGQHGEIWQLPWTIIDQEQHESRVTLKMQVQPLRIPFLIEKTITIFQYQAAVHVKEQILNMGAQSLPAMWGQHIAFGATLLDQGAHLEVGATAVTAEPTMPSQRWIQPGIDYTWPEATGLDGQTVSMQKIPSIQDSGWSELVYLTSWDGPGMYTLRMPSKNLGVRVQWPIELFKCLWFWQERYGIQQYPWWGKVFAVGLEPFSTPWSADPMTQIEAGEWLEIKSGETLIANIVLDLFELIQ